MENSEIIVIPVVFGVFAYIVKIWLDYRMKIKLIDKGMVDQRVKFLNFNALEQYAPTSLKWGLVFVLVGASLVIIQMSTGHLEGEIVFGVMLLAAGIGLLIYYFIADGLRKRHMRDNPKQESE